MGNCCKPTEIIQDEQEAVPKVHSHNTLNSIPSIQSLNSFSSINSNLKNNNLICHSTSHPRREGHEKRLQMNMQSKKKNFTNLIITRLTSDEIFKVLKLKEDLNLYLVNLQGELSFNESIDILDRLFETVDILLKNELMINQKAHLNKLQTLFKNECIFLTEINGSNKKIKYNENVSTILLIRKIALLIEIYHFLNFRRANKSDFAKFWDTSDDEFVDDMIKTISGIKGQISEFIENTDGDIKFKNEYWNYLYNELQTSTKSTHLLQKMNAKNYCLLK